MPKEGPESGKVAYPVLLMNQNLIDHSTDSVDFIRLHFPLQVFVEYEHAHQAMDSYHHLCHRTFAGKSILVTYFPPDLMDTVAQC